MISKLIQSCRRQLLLWKLQALHGWRDELCYSAQKVREAQARNQREIEMTRTRLAKLDGNAMLFGEAKIIVR